MLPRGILASLLAVLMLTASCTGSTCALHCDLAAACHAGSATQAHHHGMSAMQHHRHLSAESVSAVPGSCLHAVCGAQPAWLQESTSASDLSTKQSVLIPASDLRLQPAAPHQQYFLLSEAPRARSAPPPSRINILRV